MASETDYISQYSYQLYDTTGTTDDYLYDGLGAFSYTPEIGKEEFHPAYAEFVAEYDGRPEVDRYGNPTGRQLGGLREAYTLAGETGDRRAARTRSSRAPRRPAGRCGSRKTISYETSEPTRTTTASSTRCRTHHRAAQLDAAGAVQRARSAGT